MMEENCDDTVYFITLEMKNSQSSRVYKDNVLKKIVSVICALLNTNGGKVAVNYSEKSENSNLLSVVRTIEQSIMNLIGSLQTIKLIQFHNDVNRLIIHVKRYGTTLVTVNYNLYLPSQTQVVGLTSFQDSLTVIKEQILDRKIIEDPVRINTHQREFYKGGKCYLKESKCVQLKKLKSERDSISRLADRMTGRGNKFTCYVSAFANYKGGHLYFGVSGDGLTEGQYIIKEKDKIDITKKVEDTINAMVWPRHVKPQRKREWEIFFETVLDEECKPCPLTFVIVIYIAPCLGGVFTEIPESYEVVNGKIVKMDFSTWRRKIYQDQAKQLSLRLENLSTRISWSTDSIKRMCSRVDEILTESINSGKSLDETARVIQLKYPDTPEVDLMIMAKRIIMSYRTGCFEPARKYLKEYEQLSGRTQDVEMFDAFRFYMKTAFHRAEGKKEDLSSLLSTILDKAGKITPNIITAAIYLLAATLENIFQFESYSDKQYSDYPERLSILALEHAQYVDDSHLTRADIEQKAHINLAFHYLGYSIGGNFTKLPIDEQNLKKASSNIMAIHESIYKGNLTNSYRMIQLKIAQAVLFFRQGQVQQTLEEKLLFKADQLTEEAKTLATENNFQEMLRWVENCHDLLMKARKAADSKDVDSPKFTAHETSIPM